MAQVSPIRVILRTRLWLPVAVLTVATVLMGLSGLKARQAHLLESAGFTGQAEILRLEEVVSRDSDGNRTTRHYVTYRFEPAGGAAVQRRVSVSRTFYLTRRAGEWIPVRYYVEDPRLHEIDIGGTRREAGTLRVLGGAAMAGALAVAVWIALRWLPLFRAILGRRERRARVTGHVEKPARRKETGGRYGRILWRDEAGAEGASGWVPMLDVASHPVGSRITLIVDPLTGRTYWDEEFGDDTVGLFQRG